MIGRRSKQPATAAIPAITSPPVLSPEIEKAARVEAELADTRRDHATALADMDALRTDYEAAADVGHLSKAVAAKAALAEAETRADLAGRRVARLDAELQTLLDGAADAAAAAEREQLRVVAQKTRIEYEREFRTVMPEITAKARNLIWMHAQAEMAREAAAAVGVYLPHADTFRDIPGSPRQEISRVEHDLWLNPYGGTPYSDADQREIRTTHDGCGMLQGHNHVHRPTRKRRYVDITFRPAVMGQKAPALYETLALPCVEAGAPAGWAALKASTTPRAVLEALAALEARQSAPRPEPEVRTERQPIEPARDVRLSQDPPPYRESYGPYGSMRDDPANEQAADA